jgi:predicted alpha/beta superfamily hydrolase
MGIQRLLAWGAEAPAAFVIGIGYPTDAGSFEGPAKRNRDYAPTDGGEYARAILGSTVAPGGKAFLRFLAEELKPEIESRYSVDSGDTTFIGSSLGGLFGAWTLLTAPTTFQRYILASPLICWNVDEVWNWEQSCADIRTDLPATVFVSAGSLETAQDVREKVVRMAESSPKLRVRIERNIAWFDEHGWPRTDELAPEFVERMRSRNYAGLRIHCHNMPDETHISVPPAVISRGLRYVFKHWQP